MDWDVLGHNWAVDHLARDVASGNVRHAYLFSGPKGVGRRTLALRLAQALNCPSPTRPGEACRKCRTCRQIERMTHPDLFVIQSDHVGGTLRVDQVRELLKSMALAPYASKYRVAVLLRFEEAHVSAMNALLKTLEEPADQVVMVLTAESPESVLPTIASRCEILRLRPMPIAELSQGLRDRWDMPLDKAELLAHLSAGHPGDALRINQDPTELDVRKIWLEAHKRMQISSLRERFSFVEKITKEPGTMRTGLITWLSLWRDVLFVALEVKAPVVNLDQEEQIKLLSQSLGADNAFRMVLKLEETIGYLDSYVNPRLALEVLMLELPSTSG
jgi:DNA polymerase III subunit delta'